MNEFPLDLARTRYHRCYGPGCGNTAYETDPFCHRCWGRVRPEIKRELRLAKRVFDDLKLIECGLTREVEPGSEHGALVRYVAAVYRALQNLEWTDQLEYHEEPAHA